MVRFFILTALVFISMIACTTPPTNHYIGRWQAIGNANHRFTIRRNEPLQPNTPMPDGEPRFMLVYDNSNKKSIALEYFAKADVMLGTDGDVVFSCKYIPEEKVLKFTVKKRRIEIYVLFQKIK